MTVREFIKVLEKLDQDRNIWETYDTPTYVSEVEVKPVDDLVVFLYGKEKGVQKGDYSIGT